MTQHFNSELSQQSFRERAHGYAFPGPRGGWVVGAVLALPDGRQRFDAGRIVPEGKEEF